MSYTITLTDGTFVTLIPDNTINVTATPINLFGRGYVNYGMALNENFLYILENFSDSVAPTTPLVGQLWYNNIQDVLYLRSVSEEWVPIQVQQEPSYKEITVLDGNGNSAELDGTGNLYLQTQNPMIGFIVNYASPLSNGQVVASIQLTDRGILEISPGLDVQGNEIIQGSLNVSGATTTGNLTVVNSTTTTTLNVITDAVVSGSLTVDNVANFGVAGLIAKSNISALTLGSQNGSVLQNGGILYLTRTNSGDYAEIDFDDGTGVQGSIKLTNVGTTGWNAGATNPYALVIKNALEVDGNQLITGNLTVDGNIISSGGSYLPLSGGTCTGNVAIVESTTPTFTLNATGNSGVEQTILDLTIRGTPATVTHYVPASGEPLAGHHVIYMGGYEDSILAVDITTPQVVVYGPLTTDGNLNIGSGFNLKIGQNTVINEGDFNNSLSGNGFQKLPNGLTMQWGSIALTPVGSGGSPSTIAFPVPFAHACLSVTGSFNADIPPSSGTVGFQPINGDPAHFYGINTANTGGSLNGVSWFAIGF